jgi:hypothetical protein
LVRNVCRGYWKEDEYLMFTAPASKAMVSFNYNNEVKLHGVKIKCSVIAT